MTQGDGDLGRGRRHDEALDTSLRVRGVLRDHRRSPPQTADAAVPELPADEARKRDIACVVWTELHWLMLRDRTVTVDGDDIASAFGPLQSACQSTTRRPEARMKLLIKALREKLLANGRNRDRDHPPPLKLFNPCVAATWLFSELDEDGDRLFGFSDLGFGTPELGYSSLAEIAAIRVRFGLGIERDMHFRPRFPMSVYAEAARAAGRIVERGPELNAAVNRRDSP